MNAVEIEQAVSELAGQPFDPVEFPFAFLQAFGNKETTIKKLRTGASNRSDLGGVLQQRHIHIATCPPGKTAKTLAALRASPATVTAKARFILATDGAHVEAEDRDTGEVAACAYTDLPNRFGFFLPLAGITTVPQGRTAWARAGRRRVSTSGPPLPIRRLRTCTRPCFVFIFDYFEDEPLP